MKRTGIVCGMGVLLLVMVALWWKPAGAQDSRPHLKLAGGSTTVAPPPHEQPPSPPPPQQTKDQNIYELLTKLASIKARQAELDKVEKETTALLKKELGQLKQQYQKLGVNLEDDSPPRPYPTPLSRPEPTLRPPVAP